MCWVVPLVHFIGVNIDDVTVRRIVRHFDTRNEAFDSEKR